jgi:hypothetical protein
MYGRVILGKLATNEKSKKSLVIKASSMRSAYVNHFIHFPDFVIALIAGGLHLEKKNIYWMLQASRVARWYILHMFQKFQFGYILEGLGIKNDGTFYGHL